MLESPKNKDNEDFDIPNEVLHEDLPMPTQEDLQRMVDRQSLEYRGPEVDVYDYNPNDEQSIYDPDFELGDRTYENIKGWTLLYPDNINDAPLTIGFKDAKLFFPASDGEIKGVMPTLQDTGEPLDQKDSGGDLDIPKITISGSGEYTQWMLYDSSNDTARIFVIKDDEDINQEKLGSESKLAIGTFEVDGGVIKDYTLDIPGPEAIGGGGGGGDVCTALKAFIFTDENDVSSLRVTTGYVKNDIPKINGSELNADPTPSFSLSSAGTLWLKATFVPVVKEIDNNGTSVYLLGDGGVTEDPEFEFTNTAPTEALPEVDPDSGSVTNGLVVMRWADISSDGNGGFSIDNAHCGSLYFSMCSNTYHGYFYVETESGGGGGGPPSSLSWSNSSGSGILVLTTDLGYYDGANGVDLFYDVNYGEWVFDGYSEYLSDPTASSPQGTYSGGTTIS